MLVRAMAAKSGDLVIEKQALKGVRAGEGKKNVQHRNHCAWIRCTSIIEPTKRHLNGTAAAIQGFPS